MPTSSKRRSTCSSTASPSSKRSRGAVEHSSPRRGNQSRTASRRGGSSRPVEKRTRSQAIEPTARLKRFCPMRADGHEQESDTPVAPRGVATMCTPVVEEHQQPTIRTEPLRKNEAPLHKPKGSASSRPVHSVESGGDGDEVFHATESRRGVHKNQYVSRSLHVRFRFGKKNGKSVALKTLVDSGSCVNHITISTLKKLGFTEEEISSEEAPKCLKGFNGKRTKTLGGFIIPLRLGTVVKNVHFVVTGDIKKRPIIGVPGLTVMGLCINIPDRYLYFSDKKRPSN